MATKDVKPLVSALNVLLADTVHMYHESHGFHWNVKGPDFSQYHSLFSDIYDYFHGAIDQMAENILKLGFDSPFHMSDFVKMKTINDALPQDTPQDMVIELLGGLDSYVASLMKTFDIANSLNEQGIANFIAEKIDEGQKWAWQLRASAGLQRANKLF